MNVLSTVILSNMSITLFDKQTVNEQSCEGNYLTKICVVALMTGRKYLQCYPKKCSNYFCRG